MCALWVVYITVSEVKYIFFRILELCVQFWIIYVTIF